LLLLLFLPRYIRGGFGKSHALNALPKTPQTRQGKRLVLAAETLAMDEEDALERIMTLTNKAKVTARDKDKIQKLSKSLTPDK
jgi:hypothetical protein